MAHLFYWPSIKVHCTFMSNGHCPENCCFTYLKAGAKSCLCHSILNRSGNTHWVSLLFLQMRTWFIFTIKNGAAINMPICLFLAPVSRVYAQELNFRITRYIHLQSTEKLFSKSAVLIHIATSNLRKFVFPHIFISNQSTVAVLVVYTNLQFALSRLSV